MPTKRTYRRRGIRRRRGAKLNPRQKTQVKRLIGVRQELKYFMVDITGTALTTTPATYPVVQVPQGTTDQERDGDRLFLKKVHFRISMLIGDIHNIIRVVVYQWKPYITSSPTPNVFLNGPTGSIDILSHYNHNYRQEFSILYDKTFRLVGDGAGNATPLTTSSIQYATFTIYPKAKQLGFVGSGISSTNGVFIAFIGDSLILPNPAYSFSSKALFTDS